MDAQLNPEVDMDGPRRRLAEQGRTRVREVLTPAFAQALSDAMRETPWRRIWETPTKLDVPVEVFAAQAPQEQAAVIESIFAEATEGFQFLFDRHRVGVAAEAGLSQPKPLAAAYALLNSPEFLDFGRTLTGDEGIAYVDCQATRYLPGHFLNGHSDEHEQAGRLYAYVLNLTPGWRAEWGGWLAFLDEEGEVSEAFVPAFNTLNVFRVPQTHAVTPVAAFAGAPRYALTGWMRSHGP